MDDVQRILVACEESQAVTIELRKLGHEAYSCDIEPCSGGHPEWHILGDVTKVLKTSDTGYGKKDYINFTTQDGGYFILDKEWDMIIAFPPCTYLSKVGAPSLFPQSGVLNQERYAKGLQAKEFFMLFYNHPCPRVAIENPVALKVYKLPPYTQIIQPYEYGHPYSKKTCLWLKGLPKLVPTELIDRERVVSWNTVVRDAKTRSKTFPGIAKAMAEQWIGKVEKSGSDSRI